MGAPVLERRAVMLLNNDSLSVVGDGCCVLLLAPAEVLEKGTQNEGFPQQRSDQRQREGRRNRWRDSMKRRGREINENKRNILFFR